jgi:peroxiredoxin
MKQIIVFLLVLMSVGLYAQNFSSLAVGKKAADFKLKTLQGNEVQLKELVKNHTVVLAVLRGWPEYQCPACTRQVGALLADAGKFAALGVSVLMVYPGPSEQMQEHATEFSQDFDFPDNFYFTIDPDYTMINKYGLRWDAKKETAYPSTFIINNKGEIVFSKISTTHGGRATNDEIFDALGKL